MSESDSSIADDFAVKIREAYDALDDTDDLDWSSFETLLDEAIAAGVKDVDDKDSEFRVFKRAPPLSVLSKHLEVYPACAFYDTNDSFIALHQVVEHIGQYPSSEYTLEHVKLLCEIYPDGINRVYSEGEQTTFSTLGLLLREHWRSRTIKWFGKIMACAKWLVDKSPQLCWEDEGFALKDLCYVIDYRIRMLQTGHATNEALLRIIQENFAPIFKVHCNEMCITSERGLLQIGDHSEVLQHYMIKNQVVSAGALDFSLVLRSSYYGEDLDFWGIVISSQPDCLRSCKNGLCLFAVAAAENRSLELIFHLLSADPAALSCNIDLLDSIITKKGTRGMADDC